MAKTNGASRSDRKPVLGCARDAYLPGKSTPSIATPVRFALATMMALAAAPTFGAVWVGGTDTVENPGIYRWDTPENWSPVGKPADDVQTDFNALTGDYYTVDLGGETRTTLALWFANNNPQKYVFTNGTVKATRSTGSTLMNLRTNNQVEIENLIFAGGEDNATAATLVEGNISSKLILTGMVDSKGVENYLEVRNVGVQLDGTWTAADFRLTRNAHMVVNGTFNASDDGSGTIRLLGGDSNSTNVILELGKNAQFNVANIQVETRDDSNGSDTARIRLSEGVASKTLNSKLTFSGSNAPDWQVAFDGTGGDIIFNSDWDVTSSSTNTARVAVGTGRTVTVLGNVTQANANGAKSLALSGGGTLVHGDSLADQYQLKTGGITITDATFIINSTMTQTGADIDVNAGGTLGGNGSINRNVNLTESTATLAPGNVGANGKLTVDGNLSAASAKLAFQLAKTAPGSTVAGTDYDQLVVGGDVDISGADLVLSFGNHFQQDDVFYILDNQGESAITGTFSSLNGVPTTLNQGSNFFIGSQEFQISYNAVTGSLFTAPGVGNDVAIMAVPEPGTAGLLLTAGGWWLTARRKRRPGKPTAAV